MKIEHVPFLSVFSKLRISVSEGNFYCVHATRFFPFLEVGFEKFFDSHMWNRQA